MNAAPAIRMSDLSFSYDGSPALRDVNLTVARGEFLCVVGPNGGGKTTLLKLILGLLKPAAGDVRVLGLPPEQARSRVGYVPQNAVFDPLFPVRVVDVVLMGRLGSRRLIGPYRRADKQAAGDALGDVGLYDIRNRSFSSLSGGQRQRVLIARALASESEILLLDEPTANVDPGVQNDLHDLLERLNIHPPRGPRLTILMVTHDTGFVASIVKRVICVNATVSMHETSELRGELIIELYGRDVTMIQHDHHGGRGEAT